MGSVELVSNLNAFKLPGVVWHPTSFVPQNILLTIYEIPLIGLNVDHHGKNPNFWSLGAKKTAKIELKF